MKTQYEIAFSIFFRHEFFADGRLRSLSARPVADTERLLKNRCGLVRPFPAGLQVLYDAQAYGRQRTRSAFLDDCHELNFTLRNSDQEFFQYTAPFNGDLSTDYFSFGNDTARPARAELHREEFAGGADVCAGWSDGRVSAKPFGTITIHPHKDMEQELYIKFSALEERWCYVLARPYLQELSEPAIIRKSGGDKVFSGPQPVELPDNRQALAFFSDLPIAWRERPGHPFQLVEGFGHPSQKHRVVLPSLPAPAPGAISRPLASSGDQNYFYIFI